MAEYNFARQGWRDPVSLIAITASTAAFILAISLMVLRPMLLSQWVIPLVKAYQQFPPMRPMSYVTMMSEESAGDLTSIWL